MYLIQPIHRAGCSTGKKSTNLPSYTLTTEGARGEEPHSWRSDTMAEDAAAHQLVESEAAQQQPVTTFADAQTVRRLDVAAQHEQGSRPLSMSRARMSANYCSSK